MSELVSKMRAKLFARTPRDRDAYHARIAESLRVLRPGGRLLIVETETKGAHGLNREAAEVVADQLRSAGFAEASVSKPHKQLVVTGIRSA